jgi:RHS repeat-associated protein
VWVTGFGGITPPGNTPQANVYNGNNQIASASYDAAGNQLVVNGNTQAYDAENGQISSAYSGSTETYFYDGDGKRIEKTGPSGTALFVYDAMGRLVQEIDSVATVPPCTTCYLSADHLGSTRMVTDSGANVIGRHDFLPFGEEIAANTAGRNAQWGPGNDTVNQKFTGKERDSESGLDYFGARYYGSALGRWASPDKVNMTDDRLLSPSTTINKYVYGADNPLKYIDPDGEDVTIFYEAGFPGHTVLLAYNQDTGQSGLRSFGPDHSQVGYGPVVIGLPVPATDRFELGGIKSPDELRSKFSSITIQTSPEEAQKVIQALIEHPDGKYTVFWNNCTTTCAKLLRDINKLSLHPLTPIENVRDLYLFYGNSKVPDETSFKPGVQYGRYQPAYDPFSLLYRTINCTKYTWKHTGADGKEVTDQVDTVCQ